MLLVVFTFFGLLFFLFRLLFFGLPRGLTGVVFFHSSSSRVVLAKCAKMMAVATWKGSSEFLVWDRGEVSCVRVAWKAGTGVGSSYARR